MKRVNGSIIDSVKKIYRFISIVLIISLSVVSLCACSAKKDANTEALKDALNNSKNYVFKEKSLSNLDNISNPQVFGNMEKAIISYESNGSNCFEEISEDGTRTELFSLDGSYKIEKEILGNNGNIYAIYRKEKNSQEMMFEGDMSKEGMSEEAVLEEGMSEEGMSEEGMSEEGMSEEVVLEEGMSEEGMFEEVVSEESLTEEASVGENDSEELALDEEIVIEEPYVDVMEENDESKYLGGFSATGHKLFEVNVNNIVSGMNSDSTWLFFDSLIQIQDKIILTGDFGIVVFNPVGEVINTIPKNNLDSKIRDNLRFFVAKDGSLCTLKYYYDQFADDPTQNSYIFAVLNPEDFKMEEYEIFSGSYMSSEMFVSPGYDGLFVIGSNLYSFDKNTLKSQKVLDFIASDLNANAFNSLYAFSKEKMIGVYMDADYMPQVGFFTKVNPKDIKEKEIINIGMLYTDYNVRRHVFAANKESLEYKYNIIDYDSLYAGSTAEKLQQISKDAASGELPDILLVDPSFPVDIYISKHLFTDLYPLIDNDPDTDRNDLLPNILEAYSENGCLHQLVPAFSIETLLTKESYVNGKDSWTIYDAIDLWQCHGYDKKFAPDTIRNTLLEKILTNSRGTFINWDTGECNFDNDEFIKTLEFVKRMPDKEETIDWANYDWTEEASQYIDGKALTQSATLYSYQSYNQTVKGTWGGDCCIIGYPSDNGNGSVIRPRLSFAISDLSKNKEGAWEFVKYFLTDEYLSTAEQDWFIPNSMKALEKSEAASMERPFYIEYGTQKKVYYDQTYYMGNDEIIINPMTEEEAKAFSNYILGVNTPYRVDTNLMNIVFEESAAYFANQKSAETVAGVIQSRVSLYLAESR